MSEIINERGVLIKALAIGVLISTVMIAALMCIISAALLASSSLPYDILEYVMLGCDVIGVGIGSYISALITKRNGLITGALIGAVVFCALLAAGFTSGNDTVSWMTPLRAALMILSGSLAGIKGVNRKEKLRIK